MAKIRVYELAKELGIENKDVIAKAEELGITGKSSHSNSLDANEADQIRRAMIREAVGPALSSEVVTKRVNKATGETDMVVESRRGNIIRRRRQQTEDSVDSQEGEVAVSEVADQEIDSDSQSSDEQVVGERLIEEQSASEDAPDQLATEDGEQAKSEEGESTASVGSVDVVADVTEQQQELESKVVKRRAGGPRVLGKIELPQRKVVKPETAKPAAKVYTPVEPEEDRGAGDRHGQRKRRGKRREFSKFDLVDYEGIETRRSGRSIGKRGRASEKVEQVSGQTEITVPKASKRVVKMDEVITVADLARQMSAKSADVIAKLMELGVMATINQAVDNDIATIVAEEFDFQVESVSFDESLVLDDAEDQEAVLEQRPPVVTVMGHVDHGKTSLLDRIRNSSVAAKEHGGITQHIGAYSVKLDDGKTITFIDTPGHAAFTEMRARGAQATDIVVLVVAVDDGVMPQTIEAINHSKAANVPIIVAINKMDKPGVSTDRIKQKLAELGLQAEDWGGDTMIFPVSALRGDGVKELLEGITLLAEVREFKANSTQRARGIIIEARQDRGRGSVATVLVQAGTLRVGDIFICGAEFGRVRSMLDYTGEKVEEALPSIPVEITGLSGVPQAGDDFVVVSSDSVARQVASNRAAKRKVKEELSAAGPISLEEFAKRANAQVAVELNLILKADMHGSVEAVRLSIEKLSTEKVRVKVIHAAVGGITESDVQLAVASRAIIVGFGVRSEPRAVSLAEGLGVELRFYRVIYELLDDVKLAMVGLLAPGREEQNLGRVEVRETFSVPKIGTVAGCYVLDGLVRRGAHIRLLRDSVVVHEGRMSSLRRFKDDVREVQHGYECGIGIENFNDVKTGDVIEVYEYKEVAATLD